MRFGLSWMKGLVAKVTAQHVCADYAIVLIRTGTGLGFAHARGLTGANRVRVTTNESIAIPVKLCERQPPLYAPFWLASSSTIRPAFIGVSRSLMPVASLMALPTAGIGGAIGTSPTPRTP